MKNILTIMKKEFARFFKDRRLVLGTLILPGLLIFVLYTLIGTAFADGNERYTAKVINPSQQFSVAVGAGGEDAAMTLVTADVSEKEDAIGEIREGSLDLLIVFPENFDGLLAAGETDAPPNVEIYYDSASSSSLSAYGLAVSALDLLEDMASNLFNVNFGAGGDLSTAQEAAASYYAMLLPFLILTFLYSGCMGIAPESIAGEKERGTIATLLVTPVRRGQLVIGKVISLSVLATLSAVSSFIGTFLSLPKLMGGSIADTIGSYSVGQYFALFAVMVTAVLLIVSLISIISSFAKSVKEATSFSVPLMIVVMLVGLSTMLFTVGPSAHAAFLIPIFNCVQVMAEIFSSGFVFVNFLITVLSNLVYIVLLVFFFFFIFNSEKLIFNN